MLTYLVFYYDLQDPGGASRRYVWFGIDSMWALAI